MDILTRSSPVCGSIFRRIQDLESGIDSKIRSRRIFDGYSDDGNFWSDSAGLQELKRLDAPTVATPPVEYDDVQNELDETITLFRNVRIISTPSVKRSTKVWCSIQASVWYYNDAEREKRTGWCFVENVSGMLS